ncbi:hypothetical protein CPB85DRAFT_899547 [Mucidula mucida]|nr:hypothetical protein CPB85DRAFT_899547 [Mucidula mucida]
MATPAHHSDSGRLSHLGFGDGTYWLSWNGLYATYVTHGQSQDSILQYIFAIGNGTRSSKRFTLKVVLTITVEFNAMLPEPTNTWRYWELYHYSWFVVAPPFLGVIMGLSSQAFALVAQCPPRPTEPFSLSPATDQLDRRLLFCYSTLTTLFIILQILLVTGVKHARTYRGLIEILVPAPLCTRPPISSILLYMCVSLVGRTVMWTDS